MMITALIGALSLAAPDATPLTFLHGDEQVVTWLDRGSVRRTGDRVRSRVLRVRHLNQAFWLGQETDCAVRTTALITARNVEGADDAPPSLEGEGRHFPTRRHDRFTQALEAAVCDGAGASAPVRSVNGVAAATAALAEARAAAVRARPLELIMARAGRSPVLIDRATLGGGGPQWEVRSLKMTGGRGVWSWWEVDCDRGAWTADLRWSAPMRADGAYGPVTRDERPGAAAAVGSEEAAILNAACDADIWDRPAHGAVASAVGAGR